MKTVYLHIGNFKTGTSAIQSYCANNRPTLLNNDVDYVQAARTKSAPESHAALALSLLDEQGCYTPAGYVKKYSSQELLDDLRKEIESSSGSTALISSEECYRTGGLSERNSAPIMQKLESAFLGFSVKAIMYVKPPLKFYKAWYNQANKGKSPVKRFVDFFCHLKISLVLPHRKMAWRRNFGKHSLVIEPYFLVGSVLINRFMALMESTTDAGRGISARIVNPNVFTGRTKRLCRAKCYSTRSARI